MIKEIYQTKVKETSINIVNNEINSIRNKNIIRTGVRVINDGIIGISGFLGVDDINKAEKKAIKALANNVKYPYEVSKDKKEERVVNNEILSQEDFVNEVEILIKKLSEEFPDYILSNKAKLINYKCSLENNANLDLKFKTNYLSFGIIYKEKKSSNVFDGHFGYVGRKYDREAYLDYAREVLNGHTNTIEFEKEGKMPVIFLADDGLVLGKLRSELSGLAVGSKASIFSDKIGKKVFSDEFSLKVTRDNEKDLECFFDAEGVTLENDEYYLIKDGKIISPYADKKTADMYGFKLTSSADTVYDGVPKISGGNITISKGNKTVKELLNGEKGILVSMSAGGDYTAEGGFGTPVQVAFLFDGEKIIGRLPELQISSNVYDMFGDDFVGVSKDSFMPLSESSYIVMNMNVKRS